MASAGHREHHPAQLMYLITFILLALTVLLGFIAVFVPWVQKDIGIGVRAYAYPFKTCLVQTFSPVNEQTCLDNDFIVGPKGAPVTQAVATCEAFVLTTIAFVFISVIGGVVLLVLLFFVILRLWSRPICLASVAQFCLIIICIACILAWIFFICYAEKTCKTGTIFPVQGYSYGFIIYIFATALSLGSVVTGFMGLKKLKRYQPLPQTEKDVEVDEQVAPFDGTYPEYSPQGALTAPTPNAPVAEYPVAGPSQSQTSVYY